MAPSPLSQELKQFLRKHISSIRQLEVMIWLYENPTEEWNAQEIARSLFCQPASVEKWLEEFKQNGLLEPKNRKLVDELAREYKTRPARIIRMVAKDPLRS